MITNVGSRGSTVCDIKYGGCNHAVTNFLMQIKKYNIYFFKFKKVCLIIDKKKELIIH